MNLFYSRQVALKAGLDLQRSAGVFGIYKDLGFNSLRHLSDSSTKTGDQSRGPMGAWFTVWTC